MNCRRAFPRVSIRQSRIWQMLIILVAGAGLGLGSLPAKAQIAWDNGTGSPNPYYHTNTNWVGNSAPGTTDTAMFDINGAYDVWWSSVTETNTPQVGFLHVNDGDVTFRSVQLGSLRTLQINGSGGTGQYSDFSISGANTSLSLYGVHMHSLGRAELIDGASLIVGAAGEVAPLMTVDNSIDVSGNLLVQSGGTVSGGASGYIGRSSGSTGVATVTGSSSQLNHTNNLFVGYSGSGTLSVQSGGVVSNQYGYVGWNSAGTGLATISGSGSSWNVTGIQVGSYGSGTLIIESGGTVSNQIGVVGGFSNGVGVVAVNDVGSHWNNSTDLNVGSSGTGTLYIKFGGLVSNQDGYVGLNSGSNGVVNVSSGGTWNNSDDLYVGNDGSGTLNISSAATVSNDYGYVGRNANSDGQVNVSGSNVQWNNSSGLFVGYSGSATLDIESQGVVSSDYGSIGRQAGASGEATISGFGEWNNTSSLTIGSSGDGTLNVESYGTATNANAYIARQVDSTGVVTVDANGTWNNSGDLFVGGSSIAAGGIGTLNINGYSFNSAGLVSVGGTTKIWSTGTVNLDGGRFEFGETTLSEFSSINAISGSMAGNLNHSGYTDVGSLPALQNSAVDLTEVTLTNSGTLYGDAAFGTALINTTTGELETVVGERMRFAGTGNVNQGEINNFGGNVRFEQDMTNESGGFVTGRGSFTANSGWNNQGVMAFIGGFSEVLGDVDNNSSGIVVTSGGGTTTFYDDVVHNGSEIRTALGSNTVFLGDFSGAGAFNGLGTVFMEGDLRPGNSPSVVNFESDLVMGSGAVLFAELAGLEIGEFDQLAIDGDLTLNGQLQVALIDGFQLTGNDEFVIGDVGGLLQGQFDGLDEGALVGNFGGTDLFISYAGGDGNDVTLFTSVPEPMTLPLLGLGVVFLGSTVRRRPRLTDSIAT